MARTYITYFSKILKLLFLFVVIGVLTVYQQKTLAALVKLIIWVLSGAKWLYYIKKNKYQKYFRTSFISFGVFWGVLAVSLLLESKVHTLLFMFLFAAVCFHIEMIFLTILALWPSLID